MPRVPHLTLYGHFSGWSSYPTVCRALARWLVSQGVDLLCVNLRLEEPEGCEGLEVDICAGDRAGPVGLLFGEPTHLERCARHERMILYSVCDVDTIPDYWVTYLNRADQVLTPSRWCETVFRKCGVNRPIGLVPHGVDVAFAGARTRLDPHRPVRLLHMASSQYARKGTQELVDACARLAGEVAFELTVRGPDARPLPPAGVVALFDAHDILVQPSRAEGWGMTPLEARVAGLPVVTTSATGHADHEGPGVPGTRHVRAGLFAPCGPTGRAPSIDVEHLSGVLREAILNVDLLRLEARDRAASTFAKWSWDAALSRCGFLSYISTPS